MRNGQTRRDFLRMIGCGAAGLAVGGCSSAGAVAAGRESVMRKPNIVYILCDDLGYGDIACLNERCRIPTPNVDALARDGMTFTDAHSGSAVCTPTRYGILTGRYCWRSTLKSGVLWGYSPPLIPRERLTVASLLKNNGYATACVGKWHLGLGWATTDGGEIKDGNVDYSKRIAGGPTDLGFDYFFGIPASLDMIPYVYIENDRVVAAPTETIEGRGDKEFYRGGPCAPGFVHEETLPVLTQKAVSCIDRHAASGSDKPLFLYFPLSAPHAPILPTREFRGKSSAGQYGDFVNQVDWTVGEVMRAIERNGMTQDTLFVFTSDNGCSPVANFPELEAMGHYPSQRFRGHKADIFEGGHRIPFICRWPERIKASSSCADTVCLTDLMATAADIAGARLPDNAGEDSVSILPDLAGIAKEPLREATVHHSIDGRFSIRQGKWKLELCAGSGGWSKPKDKQAQELGLPPIQLYDMSADDSEKTNLQDRYPGVVERMTKLMQKYVDDGRSTPGAPQTNEGETNIWGPQGG